MSSFFERNQLPMVAILRNWTDHRNFTADMRSGAAVRDVTTWPIFIKFCHLTQGSARSVRRAARDPAARCSPSPHVRHPPPITTPTTTTTGPPSTAATHRARCAQCPRPSGSPRTSRRLGLGLGLGLG